MPFEAHNVFLDPIYVVIDKHDTFKLSFYLRSSST